MGLPAFRLVFITLLLGFIAACSDVSIETPTQDGYYPTEPPETFSIAFIDGQPSSYKVELNNMDVTHEFVASETGTTASGSSLVEYMIPGNNLFRVSAGSSFDQLQFYYDIEGPELHVTHVEEDENEIVISGTAVDRGGVKWVMLGETEITDFSPAYDNGTRRDFNVTIANENVISVKSEDSYGNYSERVVVRRGAKFDSPAVSARLNNSGVAFLTKEISRFLAGINLATIMPVFEVSVLGDLPLIGDSLKAGIKVEISDLGWRGDFNTDIQVVNDSELFDIAVDIQDVVLGVDVTLVAFGGDISDGETLDGEISLDNLQIETLATLSIDTIEKVVVDENGQETSEYRREIIVDLNDTALDIDGINLDSNILFNFVEDVLSELLSAFYEVFEDLFVPIFIGAAEEVIGPLAQMFIQTIPLDFAFELNDEKLLFKADPRTIDTFDGGVNVEVDARMQAGTLNKPALGSPVVPEEAPVLAATTPNGRDYHLSAALSSNFLNQALLAAHESGLTSITIDVYNNGGLSYDGLLIIKSDEDDIEPGDTFRIVFDPASPPTMELGNAGGAMGKLSLNNAKFAFDFRKQGETEYHRVFGAEVDVSAFFNLGVDEYGNLDIGIVGVPNIQVLNIDDTGALRISERFTNRVIEYLVPLAIPPIAKLLRSVPLPQIAGYGIRPEQIWSPEPYNTHLVFAGSLVKTEDKNAAPNPDTVVRLLGNVVSWVFKNTTIDIKNGTVNVNFEGFNPNQPIGQLQYRFRLDNSEWSEWSERDSVTLERLLGGDHTIEVCSRSPLLKEDPSCAVQSFETALAE